MRDALLHKASELRPGPRAALDIELGRSLHDGEGSSILTYSPHDEPQGEAREIAAENCAPTLPMRTLAERNPTKRLKALYKKQGPGIVSTSNNRIRTKLKARPWHIRAF